MTRFNSMPRFLRTRAGLVGLALLLYVCASVTAASNWAAPGMTAAQAQATPSPSPSPSASPSPSPNASPSPSPSPNASPSPSPSPNASPSPSPSPGGVSEIRIRATLAGALLNGMTPRAEVEFRSREDGGRRELEVELENVNLPGGTSLDVLVDNVRAGSIVLDGDGRGEVRLRQDDGQNVPAMNLRSRLVVVNSSGATIVGGSFTNLDPANPTPQPSDGETRIIARLAGAALNNLAPKGKAEFRERSDRNRRKFKAEVERINLPAGTRLNVLVSGTKVGEIVVTQFLRGQLELDTNNGQFVPALTNGTTVVVTNQSGVTVVSGVVNFLVPTVAGNSIDDALFFVQQQYLDFFDREADDKGLDFWKNQITQCGSNDDCLKGQRINTSGAFFMSIEFQNTGYMLYRLNKVSFGQRPLRREFLIDMQKLGRGVVVGATGWEVFLEANKRQFVTDWANSANFRALYDALTNEQFVDKLAQNAGVTLTANERAALADGLRTGADTRAGVLRKLAENESLKRREFNAAFVLMQYFGYLHRDPDDAGFNFWLKKLEEFGGDFHKAQMVEAFITAGEYRGRFNW